MPLPIDELNRLKNRLDEIENDSNEEWFSEYPYDAQERADYADFMELLLIELFENCIDNRIAATYEDFFWVYLNWCDHIAQDMMENVPVGEEPIEALEKEYSIDLVQEAKEYAEYSEKSSDTVKFNNFIETHDFDSEDEDAEIEQLKTLVAANSRSKDMSRTETNIMCNYFVHDTAKKLFKYHRWVTILDGKERETHALADGQTRPIDEPFEVGGSKMMYPCDTTLGASVGEIINCRCHEEFTNDAKNLEFEKKKEEIAKEETKYPVSYRRIQVEKLDAPKDYEVTNLLEYTRNGVAYKVGVDGVKISTNQREKEVIAIFGKQYGGNIDRVPEVMKDRVPDFEHEIGEFEIKSPTGSGKDTVYDAIKGGKGQANDFVLDLNKYPKSYEEAEKQIEKVFWSKHTRFVNSVMTILDDEIRFIYYRK